MTSPYATQRPAMPYPRPSIGSVDMPQVPARVANITASRTSLFRVESNLSQTAPPVYVRDVEAAPAYFSTEEPKTLARRLFFIGFIFFPAWAVGSLLLIASLRAEPEWVSEKTEEERAELLALIRRVEVKWARRCLTALLGVALVVACGFAIMKASG